MEFLSYLISGISLGSVYAIIALGYTMVYGIAKMLNFAHGDVIMVGGYITFCAMSYLGLPGWAALILAMIFCTVLGIVIEGLAYRPLREAPSRAQHRRFSAPSFPPPRQTAPPPPCSCLTASCLFPTLHC